MENPNDKDSVELIQIDIVENSKEDQPPKTAKDLFSVFKVSDDSDYEPDENNGTDTDSDEPLSKRMKVKTKKQAVGEKTKEPESTDGSLKKKVLSVIFSIINYILCFQKYYSQKYKKEWEAIPSVRPWISESIHGPHYFYCRFCKKDYKCGKTEIFKHMSAMKHRKHLTTTTSGVQVS